MASQRPPRRGNQPPRDPKSKTGGPSQRKVPGSRRPITGSQTKSPSPARVVAPSTSASRSTESSGPERLQKILAHAGIGSRRACEELILQGRVTVGGQVVRELGTKVDPARTQVAVDGQRVQSERLVYFAVYKPKGYVSTNDDPSGRPRVLDILPEIPQRVYTVGRLDEMSVGLMLLTNDGELANKLAHPRFGVEKLYRVVVAGSPARETLNQLTEGIWLAEGKVRAKSVRAIGKRGESTILEMVLAEGKNREVRRMLAKLGHKVMTLTRVAVGPITIKGLTAGQYRPLTGREVDLLQRVAAGQPVPMPWKSDRQPRRDSERPRRPDSGPSPVRRPGAASSGESRPGPRGRSGSSGGSSRPASGPRPGLGGINRHSDRPGFPQHPGPPPSERPNAGRQAGGPPTGHRQSAGGPPRPGGPRPYQNGAARPGSGRRFDEEGPPRTSRRPDGSSPGQSQSRRGPSEGLRRQGGPRPVENGPTRPMNGAGGHRRPGPPPSEEPRPRRVIGLGPEVIPPPTSTGNEDRPKPRSKRPVGKRPLPRPAKASKPMPKPRRTGLGKSD